MTPAAADEMIDHVRWSGLVPEAELRAAHAALGPGESLVRRLQAAGRLTRFQADRLADGKFRGFVIGGYVILDRLGTGGMGQVFLAEHTAMRRLVAVKVLNVPADEDPVAVERFLREARAAAAVNHPNIVRVFDLNRDGLVNYQVLEYVEGLTLDALLKARGRAAVGAAAFYARQVAQALQHSHDRGLVHRDVKPTNVMVDRHGAARLLDLGLVRFEREVQSKLTAQSGGTILGTADYLAPEQVLDSSAVDIRADVYGLGATLYHLLAGHPMFPLGKTAQKLMWQQWKEPTPIRELRPEVPDGLAAVLTRSLAKKPADRFQTPQQMADALAPYSEPTAPPADLIPAPPPRTWAAPVADAGPPSGHPGSMAYLSLAETPRPPGSVPTLELPATVALTPADVPPPARPAPGFLAGVAVGAGALAVAAVIARAVAG